MNATATIDKQISSYLLQLNPKQKKTVLGIVKTIAEENDSDFDKEMERRFTEFENGTEKGYTLEEAAAYARKSYKASKNRV